MPEKNYDELIRIIKKEKSSSPVKATAAYKELKNRGYDPEEIKHLLTEKTYSQRNLKEIKLCHVVLVVQATTL